MKTNLRNLFCGAEWKRRIVTGFSLAAASSAAFPCLAQSRVAEYVLNAVPAERLTIDLETGGALRVRGSEENAVRVRVQLSARGRENISVTLESVPGGARLHSSASGDPTEFLASHVFEVFVPRHYDISLNSAGGRLTITDVSGEFRGDIAGGMIVLERVRGWVEISTTGGAIHVTDSALDGSIKTGGGGVKLRRVTGGVRAWAEPRPLQPDPQPHR